jgi:hypothetical protein
LLKIPNKPTKPELRKLSKALVTQSVISLHKDIRKLDKYYNSKLEVLQRRIDRRDVVIKKLRYENFVNARRLYAQKLRMSKDKTVAKKATYEKALNNIVSKRSELIDIPKYHMALFEVSQIFEKPEMVVILLLWASRYEYYSMKEFKINFKNSPLKFLKYNNMLVRDGYANKWEQKRNTYFVSAQGKELVEKINKFVYKRLNG